MDWTCTTCSTRNPAAESFCSTCGSGAPHAFPDADGHTDPGPTSASLPPLPPGGPAYGGPGYGGPSPDLPPQQSPGYPPGGPAYGGPGGPGGPGYGGAYGQGGQPPRRRRRGLLIGISAVVVLALVAGVVAVVLLTRGSTAEVTLEPVDATASDSYGENYDVDVDAGKALSDEDLGDDAPDNRLEQVDASLSGRAARGSDDGLYGGSRDTRVCATTDLVDFLDAEDDEKARAWAEALDIEPADIEDYVATLTAVRLRWDTRVTNHGYAEGAATERQALLQAGTAVLVDERGVPRVKCNGGNPLDAAARIGGLSEDRALDVEEIAANPEAAWARLDPAQAVSIEGGDEDLEEITIVDVDTRGLLERPVGSDGDSKQDVGTGDVQLTLEWGSNADLDLSVVEPDGNQIYHANRGPSSSNGQLDVDANVSCPADAEEGVENIFWPEGDAPAGDYEVQVYGYSVGPTGDVAGTTGCGDGSYTLTITVGGEEDVRTGTVAEGASEVVDFSVG